MHIAFYKAKGKLFNRVIRAWELGPYSHVEIVHFDAVEKRTTGFSSSFMDKGVRGKTIVFKAANWDVIDLAALNLDEGAVLEVFRDKDGFKYDVKGCLRFGIGPIGHSTNKAYCAEICADALGLTEPWRYGVNALASTVIDNVNRAAKEQLYKKDSQGHIVDLSGILTPEWLV